MLKLEGFAPFLLEPVDLAVKAGEILFLTGPSGSGKSLFLRALSDLDSHVGEVWLNESRMADILAPDWRRKLGYLTAESHWWFDRAGDHFKRPDPAGVAALGLPEPIFEWPVSRLSSGEKQRLALLRLLQQAPQVLLLDEPTANQDPDTTLRVEQCIWEYVTEHGAPALWVSHNPDQMARIGGRKLAIKGKKVVFL